VEGAGVVNLVARWLHVELKQFKFLLSIVPVISLHSFQTVIVNFFFVETLEGHLGILLLDSVY